MAYDAKSSSSNLPQEEESFFPDRMVRVIKKQCIILESFLRFLEGQLVLCFVDEILISIQFETNLIHSYIIIMNGKFRQIGFRFSHLLHKFSFF